jgi:lysophospholipase L1-like esterase
MSPVNSLVKHHSSFRLRPTVLLYGDSITQFGFGCPDSEIGWASLLSAAYKRRCDVLNRGFSGYNTRHALELLPRVFGEVRTATADTKNSSGNELLFCTVFFGANDAALPGEPQHVPIEDYATNVDKIVVAIRERCSASSGGKGKNVLPIIFMTPPPVDEKAWAVWRKIEKSDRSNHITRKYGLKVKDVAARHELCSVVDTWELLEGNDDNARGQYLSDGLHLNEKGNRMIYRGLMDVIQKEHPHLAPMSDEDGEGRYGESGIPLEEKLWKELC